MTDCELLQRLEQASVCCKDCGLRYGVYSVGCSSSWMGTCHVCGAHKSITETRDYAYLITGRRKLAQLLEKDND
jgi:predicted ATP-dependent serine protease